MRGSSEINVKLQGNGQVGFTDMPETASVEARLNAVKEHRVACDLFNLTEAGDRDKYAKALMLARSSGYIVSTRNCDIDGKPHVVLVWATLVETTQTSLMEKAKDYAKQLCRVDGSQAEEAGQRPPRREEAIFCAGGFDEEDGGGESAGGQQPVSGGEAELGCNGSPREGAAGAGDAGGDHWRAGGRSAAADARGQAPQLPEKQAGGYFAAGDFAE